LASGKKSQYNEERTKIAFILPVLEVLGWNPRTDEVLPEQATLTGRADFGLRIGGKTKIYVEIKSINKSLDGYDIIKGKHRSYSEQAINYAWSMKSDWALLTNFEEIRLFDSHVTKPENGIVWKTSIKFNEYVSRYDELWLISKTSIASGALDAYKRKSDRPIIDEVFLNDLMYCRQLLAEDIKLNNPNLSMEEINENVQKILDRLIFIKNCEDRLIIPAESLWKRYELWRDTTIDSKIITFMMDLKNMFIYFDQVYDGKLFERHRCEDLVINNDIMKEILNILYGDEEHYGYDFSVIPIDVLGHSYELYIGSIIKEKEGEIRAIEIVKDPRLRKSQGIYYTPEYIVNFLVNNTLSKLVDDIKSPKDISTIKLVDPACGSGSFLIKSYDIIKKWYNAYNDSGKDSFKNNTLDAHLVKIIDPEYRILTDNLYGVDLDPQAVEISILNLSLKAIVQRQKLPYIGNMVKCGNSLIEGNKNEIMKYFHNQNNNMPFNWKDEFKSVFSANGFDIIVSNPPYITMENLPDFQEYCREKYSNVYSGKNDICYYFITRGIELLKNGGFLGYIVSRYFLEAAFAQKLRDYVTNNTCIKTIIDFGNNQVFDGVSVLTCLIILQKEENKEKRDSNIIKIIKVKGMYTDIENVLENINSDIESSDKLDTFKIKQSDLNNKEWRLASTEAADIFSKIENISLKLGDISIIEQTQKTGLNDAFIVDKNYAIQNNLEQALLKKVIKNSDILKYHIDWKNKYLIYVNEDVNIELYPNIKKHLEQYKIELTNRAENKDELYPWFRLQRPRREWLFSKEKLIVPYLSTENRFAYDNVGYYGTADSYIIVPKKENKLNIKFILALLNSNLIEYFHKKNAKLKREEYFEYLRKPLSAIPIKNIDFSNVEEYKIYQEITKLSESAINNRDIYYTLINVYNNILNQFSDSNTEFVSFYKDYYLNSSLYDINMIDSIKMISDKEEGQIIDFSIIEEINSIIIRYKYINNLNEEKEENLLKITFNSEEMKKFFFFSIKSYLAANYKKHNWGKGKIWENSIKKIKIPKFVTNREKNKEIIQQLMKEFFKISNADNINLTTIENNYRLELQKINSLVYKLYMLNQYEIDQIEKYIDQHKKYISKTI